MLTEDTCVTEPVDTAQREKAVRARREAGGRCRGGGRSAPAFGPIRRHAPYRGLVRLRESGAGQVCAEDTRHRAAAKPGP